MKPARIVPVALVLFLASCAAQPQAIDGPAVPIAAASGGPTSPAPVSPLLPKSYSTMTMQLSDGASITFKVPADWKTGEESGARYWRQPTGQPHLRLNRVPNGGKGDPMTLMRSEESSTKPVVDDYQLTKMQLVAIPPGTENIETARWDYKYWDKHDKQIRRAVRLGFIAAGDWVTIHFSAFDKDFVDTVQVFAKATEIVASGI
ncbi:hypothetical protein EV193_105275 [Herbihabitans rhizosphaerae]|uniref:Lipoprotein LpqN n=1 Tax=Herbihabitans rhizosphaerae TaxID=1872711 RepID=A0A4Q7KN36_9PSEU|nr:hypothetical protein [Herbihabitans rhizosphaerae]RZS37717.1 hypothetical protein EV193_105275 [Herbihabitans rhizosphaerae]